MNLSYVNRGSSKLQIDLTYSNTIGMFFIQFFLLFLFYVFLI